MSKREIWNHLKHFKKNERNHRGLPAWGNSDKVSGMTLMMLDELTDRVKRYSLEKYNRVSYCIVHCAYDESGHAVNSEHYRGSAIDFHFTNVSQDEVLAIAEKLFYEKGWTEFIGFGFYLDWANPGFHLDSRGYKARWARDKGNYIGFSEGVKMLLD